MKNPDVFERHLFSLVEVYGKLKMARQEEDFDEEEITEITGDLAYLVKTLPDTFEGKAVFSEPEHRGVFKPGMREDLMNSFINCIQTVDPNNSDVYEELPGQPDSALGEAYFDKHDKGVISEKDIPDADKA